MSLLDTASLIVTPNAYKEGKLYSVIPSDGAGDMTVVRATTATRVNADGLVELVPYNLIRRSQEFNLIWSPVRSSITANTTIAPDGTLTAESLFDNADNNIHYIAQTFTAITGAATISIFAKANQISQIQLVAQGGTTPMGRGFNLSTGTVFTESVGGVSSNDLGQSITDVGNGWYRCEMSWTSTGQNEFWILLSVSNAATFMGTGSNSVFIWGAQLVEGLLPKDYQKTETRLNIPRLDYYDTTCPSLLVEPQRTNLVFPSATLVTQTRVVTAAAHTLSFYGTGSIALTGVHTATLTGTGANNRVTLTFTPTAGNLTLTVTGAVTDAQLEAGSYPTSYIPTTTASVTRNADVISKTGIGSFFGTNQGTIFCDFICPNIESSTQYIFDTSDGVNATTNRLAFYKIAAGSYELFTNTSTSISINPNTRNKVAIVYNGASVKVFANGSQQASITYANTNPSKINLGSRFNNVEIGNVEYNSYVLFPTALADTECQTLTTL